MTSEPAIVAGSSAVPAGRTAMAMPSASLVPNSDDTSPRALFGDRACEGGVEEPVEPGSEFIDPGGALEAEQVERVLILDSITLADSVGDLVCLGGEQGTSTGDPHRHQTLIVCIERTAHNLSRSPTKGHRLRHDRPAATRLTDREVGLLVADGPTIWPRLSERRLDGATVPPAQSRITAVVAPRDTQPPARRTS